MSTDSMLISHNKSRNKVLLGIWVSFGPVKLAHEINHQAIVVYLTALKQPISLQSATLLLWKHLICFHILAIVKTAALNILVHVISVHKKDFLLNL